MSGTYLDSILAAKRAELSGARAGRSATLSDSELADLGARLPPARDFIDTLRGQRQKPAFIAEFKRASPSAGTLREDADPRTIATHYAAAGAAAISVLCDRHFQGSLEDLREVRQAVTLPLLCKDFILERWQIVEAKRTGADAILLIAAALEAPLLRQLIIFAHDLGMQVLCETHDAHEVDRAMAAGARLIGVNARDLRTFETDLQVCVDLRAVVPAGFTYVAESGVNSVEDAKKLADAGVDAILVGSYLMRAESPGDTLRELVQSV